MPHTLGDIAEAIGAELRGDPRLTVTGMAALPAAGEGHLAFLGNSRFSRFLKDTRATAVILARNDADRCPVNALIAADPYVAYVKAARLLNPLPRVEPGIHRSAAVHSSARVDAAACVCAGALVEAGAVIGAGARIGPGSVVGEGAVIGEDTRLGANVTICAGVEIGSRTLIHPGAVVGADGFGLANEDGKWLKIPQLGSVLVGSDVEIGANTTIDRGALEDTIIEDGVKIDNLVQIGHNTKVGAHTAIAGCAVIAGSVVIGRRCMIGGATAITGHIEIADDVVITGMSGVSNSITEAGMYSGGIGTTDNRTWRRNMVRFRHLDELARKVLRLESELEKLRAREG